MKAVHFFKIFGTNYATTQCNNPDDLLCQQLYGGNLESLF